MLVGDFSEHRFFFIDQPPTRLGRTMEKWVLEGQFPHSYRRDQFRVLISSPWIPCSFTRKA